MNSDIHPSEIPSKEQLVRICKLIMAGANSSAPVTTNPDQISFEWASNRILSSASFWELHNIRGKKPPLFATGTLLKFIKML